MLSRMNSPPSQDMTVPVGGIWLLTEDHSLVNEQLKSGLIEEEDVESFEAKNIITRSVGYEREVLCDVVERQIPGDEHFVLCSDGLHGLIGSLVIVIIMVHWSLVHGLVISIGMRVELIVGLLKEFIGIVVYRNS